MKWKHPPIIKIYEALGAIADGRVEVSDTTAKVYSSTGSKYYDVAYDPHKKAIMANDNGSYWKGYLGYPTIAFLMKARIVSYNSQVAHILKNILWKDINQRYKNDFDKTLEYILSSKTQSDRETLGTFVAKVNVELKKLKLNLLGTKVKPPEGY